MYDREAQETLLSDPASGLTHLYHNHIRGYVREFGLEVIGAGSAQANGWYHRRDASEGPPESFLATFGASLDDAVREEWLRDSEGHPWYESDGGSLILWGKGCERGLFSVPAMWSCSILNDGRLDPTYYVYSSATLPPVDGWSLSAVAPAAISP